MTRNVILKISAGVLIIAAGIVYLSMTYAPDLPAQNKLFIACAFAAFAFGGLAAVFAGMRGLIYGVCAGICFAIMNAAHSLPLRVFAACALAALAFIYLRKRAKDGISNADNASAEYDNDALLIRNGARVSQYLRDEDKIYILKLYTLADTDNDKPVIKRTIGNIPEKGKSILRVSNISGVQCKKSAESTYIRLRRRDRSFTPWREVMAGGGFDADARIAQTFEGIPIEWKADNTPKRNAIHEYLLKRFPRMRKEARAKRILRQRESSGEGRKIISRYEKLRRLLLAPCVICQALWLFTRLDYGAMCVANIAMQTICILTYFYRLRAGRTWNKHEDERELAGAVFMSGFTLIIRTSIDYNLDDYSQLFVPVMAIAAVFAFLLLFIKRGKKPVKSWAVVSMLCVLIYFVPAASVQLNALMDNGGNAIIYMTEVADMDVLRSSRSPAKYTLTLNAPHGSIELDVAKELYYSLEVGDSVEVVTSTGPIGITYTYAK